MNLDKFFFPQSTVVFGVSNAPGNLGKGIIENLNSFGFKGTVYGVGRKAGEILGKPVFTKVDEIQEQVDLAVLLVPARTIPDAVESCGRKGIGQIIIESAGFSELGEEGKALEMEILRIARQWGLTVMGPNCVGTINLDNGLCASFIPTPAEETVKGSNAFISQSGGLVYELFRRCGINNVGISKVASIGNMLMVEGNDILQFFIDDPSTQVIGVYLESIRNGRHLMNLISGTEKPVIILKGNSTPLSKQVAAFHTAALVGDDTVTEAAFKQAGAHRVESLGEMIESFKIFSLPLMRGTNLVIMARSGGQSSILADQAHKRGFTLPELPSALRERIKAEAKGGVVKNTNPIDMGDVYNESTYLELLEMSLQMDATDGVVFYYEYPRGGYHADLFTGRAKDLSDRYNKPVVFCMVLNKDNALDMGTFPLPVFIESERAFDALHRSLDHWRRIGTKERAARIPLIEKKVPEGPARILPPEEIFSLMQTYDIPVAPYQLVRDVTQGLEAAREIGYPVVLKRMVPFVLHKTEAGALRLDIADAGALSEAFLTMPGSLYLLQKRVSPGIDLIIGGKADDGFGPTIAFGLGGIFVEVLQDVTLRVAPVDEREARKMVGEIRGAAILRGTRGMASSDLDSLSKTIVKVSRLLADHPEFVSLDINPLRLFESGAGCCALDIKIEALISVP